MKKLFFLITLTIPFLYVILSNTGKVEYTKEEICSSVYIIEGKEKAKQPFGIETIECKTYEKCEQICFNTVKNNRIRFKNQTKEKDFLTFLAKRYCPPNWEVWLKNLKFYLKEK